MKSSLVLSLLLAAATLPAAASDYPLEKRSGFASEDVARNPFWPIGYVHQEKRAPVVSQQVVAAPKLTSDSFVVSSILIGGGLPLAVVNGREVAVGDQVSVEGTVLKVAAILDGQVTLIADSQSISVPLRRR